MKKPIIAKSRSPFRIPHFAFVLLALAMPLLASAQNITFTDKGGKMFLKNITSWSTKLVNGNTVIHFKAKGAPLKTSDVPTWRELRAMGVVREKVEKPNRFVLVTALGAEVLTEEGK